MCVLQYQHGIFLYRVPVVLSVSCRCAAFAAAISLARAGRAGFQFDVVFWRACQLHMMCIRSALPLLAIVSALRLSAAAGPLETLVGVFEHAPVSMQEPDPAAQGASSIMHSLAGQTPRVFPHAGAVLDPSAHHARAACDRDFSQQCPSFFSPAGVGKCAPASGYTGPCAGGVQSFEALSPSAKERWSELCSASWPCIECRRDFSSLCPIGWVSAGGTTCKPTAAYSGPCGAVVNFAGFTRGMMSEWSSVCGAHWRCVA